MSKDQNNHHQLPGKPEGQEPEMPLDDSRLHMQEPWLSILLQAAIEAYNNGNVQIDDGCLILNDTENPKRDEKD